MTDKIDFDPRILAAIRKLETKAERVAETLYGARRAVEDADRDAAEAILRIEKNHRAFMSQCRQVLDILDETSANMDTNALLSSELEDGDDY